MAGIGTKALTVVQYGLESVHGTPVAADTRLIADVTLPENDREIKMPKAGVARRVNSDLAASWVGKILATGITMTNPEDGNLYYQILPLLFSCGLDGNITPVEQTASEGDYLWTFTEKLTGAEDADTFTLEQGDDTAANLGFEVAHCLITALEIAGNADTTEVSWTATIDGAAIVRSTLTGVATLPSYTPLIGKLFRLYIDNTWAGLGGTEIANALLDFTLRIEGGLHHKMRGGATRAPAIHGQREVMATLSLGLERNAITSAESAYFFADTTTPRFVRLEIDSGVQIGAGENHKFTVDMAGVFTGWPPLGGEQDGNTIERPTLTMGYDATGTRGLAISCITDVAAI